MDILTALKGGLRVYDAYGTEAVGRALGRELPPAATLALYGDLGAGKTTLVRGLADVMGYPEITSPSFNYYFLYQKSGCRTLLHLDAYRLDSPDQYPSLMIDQLLDPEGLFVIEWPENLGEYLPESAYCLHIEGQGGSRQIRLD